MIKNKTVSYRDLRENLKHNMHLLLSPLNCDYVSARYLIISDNLNRSALALISQFLEKSLKQIIILENKGEVLKHFQEENEDIFSYIVDKKKLGHHNLIKILNDFNQIETFKEILKNDNYLDFIDSFSEYHNHKYFSGLRYGLYSMSISYPAILDILDELAYKFVNVEIARLSDHPVKVQVPENMVNLFLLKNKKFSIENIIEIACFPEERLNFKIS